MSKFKVELESEYKGCKYVVLFQEMGHRCGYVGVSKSNPLYGHDYNDKIKCLKKSNIENDEIGKRGIIPLMCMDADEEYLRADCYFDVHGGITYTGGGGDYPVKSDLWWYGFDCAHCDDGKDIDLALEYGLIDEKTRDSLKGFSIYSDYGEMRSLEYVKQECKNLIDQINDLEGGYVNENCN